jgi:hypothetical protein
MYSFVKLKVLLAFCERADLPRFLHKSVRHRSLTDISSRSEFDFEFAEIFVIEKRLPDSPSRGVAKEAN